MNAADGERQADVIGGKVERTDSSVPRGGDNEYVPVVGDQQSVVRIGIVALCLTGVASDLTPGFSTR